MNFIPSSTCSTTRAAAIPRTFSTLWMRAWSPALCGVLALMLSGASVSIYAQTAHSAQTQTSSNVNFGAVNVGSASPTAISVILAFGTAETLGSTAVVTQGATGLDFTDAGTGTCKAGTAYNTGDTCAVDVRFTPKFPGTRYGAAKLLDGSGNVIATGYVQGTGVGPQVNFLPGAQSVIAKDKPPYGYFTAIAVDGSGSIYIADGIGWVLKETPTAGGYTQSVVANGLSTAIALAVDGSGNVYVYVVSESGNNQVLKETLSAAGYTQSVVLNAPNDLTVEELAVDGSGNVYLTDVSNEVLKETLSAGGYTQSVVANAASNGLFHPRGLAVDGSGNVYITDGNKDVLKETPSADGYTQSVIANAANNGLSGPTAVAVDGSGNVYLVDWNDSSGVIRVLKETLSAGSYTQSVLPISGIIPQGIAVDGSGNVYIADSGHYRVLKEDFADPPSLNFVPTSVGATSTDSPQTVTVSNDGNAALIFPLPATGDNPSVPTNFDWDSSSTCKQTTANSSAFELAVGASCTMAIDFKPTVTGSVAGLAELTDNNLNVTGAVQGIHLAGTGREFSQTITFPQPASPVYHGVTPITLSVTGGASGNPVIFSIVSGPGSLSGPDSSILSVNGWGEIVIAANQAGNADYAAAPQVTRSITALFSQQAALTAPTPGGPLPGSGVTFTWSPGVGVTQYLLYLGSTGVRSSNLYNSGETTATSVTLTGLPINGERIYARLYSLIAGNWHSLDYTYTATSLATLTSPTPNSTLTGSNVTFTWSPGIDVSLYYLFLGSSGAGSNDLYSSGYKTAKSVNVTGLPVNGETVYARLYSFRAGAWHYLDYTYTAK
jgi:hypothetical protein